MPLARIKDHTKSAAAWRASRWGSLIPLILKKRREDPASTFASNKAVLLFCCAYQRHIEQYNLHSIRSQQISLTSFEDHRFPFLPDNVVISKFRFRRQDVLRMTNVIAWPQYRTATNRNRYSVSPLLATCVILRRIASPARWKDMETFFGRHESQLSEIFWEALTNLVSQRVSLLMDDFYAPFWGPRFEDYANAIKEKCRALDNVTSFIDGTVIAIARPGGQDMHQRFAYNGHKRKHALKFQALTSPCGMAMHLAGPIEGRRHDWTLYLQSNLDNTLAEALNYSGKQYCVYGDSGYTARSFLYVPFAGSNLSNEEKAFNRAMSTGRVSVEWFFQQVKLQWTILDYKRKLRVRESAVGTLYIAAVLLTNFRNCLYPNLISQFFKCTPPSLEDYINHRENNNN